MKKKELFLRSLEISMFKKKYFYFVLVIVLVFPLYASESIPAQIDIRMMVSDGVSLKDAKNELLRNARQKALESAIPFNLSITSLITSMYSEQGNDFDEKVAQSVFANSSMAGFFTNEIFQIHDPVFFDNSFELRIEYKADIIPRHEYKSQSNLFDLKLDECYIKSGNSVTIEIKPYTTGYCYLFNFMSDNSVILLYPNIISKENEISKDETKKLKFTAFKDQESGHMVTVETIYAIYSLKEIYGWQKFKNNINSQNIIFSAGDESFRLFQEWLSSADYSSIEEEMVQIHIY